MTRRLFCLVAVAAIGPSTAKSQPIAVEGIRKRFGEVGIEAIASTPEELTARLRKDIEKWAKVIEKAGIPKQ